MALRCPWRVLVVSFHLSSRSSAFTEASLPPFTLVELSSNLFLVVVLVALAGGVGSAVVAVPGRQVFPSRSKGLPEEERDRLTLCWRTGTGALIRGKMEQRAQRDQLSREAPSIRTGSEKGCGPKAFPCRSTGSSESLGDSEETEARPA